MDEIILRQLDPEQLKKLEQEGFDRTEPSTSMVTVFTIAILVTIVVVVVGVTYLFEATLEKNEIEKVLTRDSVELREIRTREAEQLNHYRYLDREKGVVRLPIDRAMELFAAEAAQGKLFYPARPARVKTAEELAAAAGGGAAGAQPGAQPNAAPGAGVEQK